MIKNCRKYFFYFFFILIISDPLCLMGNQKVREILNTIPDNDKIVLEDLFQELFNRNNFSYTLFGDKPMSLASYFKTPFDGDNLSFKKSISFWYKWKIWRKYEPAFPIERYLLIENAIDTSNSKELYFINKELFIVKVNEHLDLFKKTLGEDITGDLLLKKIEENPKFISFLNHSPMLLGILLGYGEHNARLFETRSKIGFFVYRKEFPNTPIKIPDPSKDFLSLQDEFDSYFSILTLFGEPHYSPLLIHSVFFVADHKHPETSVLAERFKEQRGKICTIYAEGDFLEITLRKLTD